MSDTASLSSSSSSLSQQDASSKMSENFNPQWTNEKIIAEELSSLSTREREEAYEDIHGVGEVVKETPELIEASLQELDNELRLVTSDRYAYDLAESISRDHVNDRSLRLKFLRATQFDPKRAAARMTEFFRHKLDLFGREKLAKHITFEDLGQDARDAITQGMMHQVLPSRDTKGRAVVCGSQRLFLSQVDRYQDPVRTLAKAFWYVVSSVVDDEETQKKGWLFVSYTLDSNQPTDAVRQELLRYCAAISTALPVRPVCLHYCTSSTTTKTAPLKRAIITGSDTSVRVRTRTHSGTHSEVQYSLMSFGIPTSDFPFLEKREVKKTNHLKWIERRKKKEEYLANNPLPSHAVDIPSRSDVILGRGTPFNMHPGNKRLHEMVADYYDEYDREMRVGKTKLAEKIVSMVHGYGGKFLKLDEECGMWVEVSPLDARNKVAHGFRRKRESATKASKAVKVTTTVLLSEGYGAQIQTNKRLRVPYHDGTITSMDPSAIRFF